MAFIIFFQKTRFISWVVLKTAVRCDYYITFCMGKASCQCSGLAEVAPEADDFDALVMLVQLLQNVESDIW
jgi:hypothetical protein